MDTELQAVRRPRWRVRTIASLGALAFVMGVAVSPAFGLSSGHGVHSPTFGRIPQSALTASGIDWSLVPDYVAVVAHGSVVGYVAKSTIDASAKVIGPLNGGSYTPGRTSVLTVVNRTLTPVGHFYPVRGFVRSGDAQPVLTVTATTVYGGSGG